MRSSRRVGMIFGGEINMQERDGRNLNRFCTLLKNLKFACNVSWIIIVTNFIYVYVNLLNREIINRSEILIKLIMSNIKEMSNVLIDSVLLGNLRMFGFEEEKPKVVIHEPETDQIEPPEPITSEKLKEINNRLGMIYTCFPESKFHHLIFV